MFVLIYSIAIIASLLMFNWNPGLATIMLGCVYIVGILHGSGRSQHQPPTNMNEYQKFYNKNKPPKPKTFIQLEYDEETETYNEKQVKCHM